MSLYHGYTMHMHSNTCLQKIMYNMHTIPHVHQYHMYNMYTIPPVQSTTYTMCAQHLMYMTPPTQRVHNATCILYHMYNVYTIPHVHSITCMTCTQHHMYTTSQVKHVQHMHNSSTKHPKTTLSLPSNLVSSVFPPSMLIPACRRSHYFHSIDVHLNITCHNIDIM